MFSMMLTICFRHGKKENYWNFEGLLERKIGLSMEDKKFYLESSEQVLFDLKSSPEGLTANEAEERLTRFGPNKLKEEKQEPAWKRFLAQMKDPMFPTIRS